MSLFISIMRPFYNDARDKSERWEAKVEMRKTKFLLKVKCHFVSAEKSSFNQVVLGENALKNNPQRRPLRNRRYRGSGKVVEIINLDDLVLLSLRKKRARTKRATTPRNIISRGAMTTSAGNHWHQRSKKSTARPPVTMDIVKKMTVEAKHPREDQPQSREEKRRPTVHSTLTHD